jgi:hypothetical protein
MDPRQASATSRSGLRGQPVQRGTEELRYRAARLTLPIPGVREFQKRYEAAVPELPLADVEGFVSRKGRWSEMVELIDAPAPRPCTPSSGKTPMARPGSRPTSRARNSRAKRVSAPRACGPRRVA